ncbi:MAG: HEAT repeat domain-containing protein [Planctomycetota bacterium]
MTDAVDLKFCDLCGHSIPLRDLSNGTAREVADHVVGACCVSKLLDGLRLPPQPVAVRAASSGIPGLYAAMVLLITMFLIAYFLDFNAKRRNKILGERLTSTKGQIEAVQKQFRQQAEVLSKLPTEQIRTRLSNIQASMSEWEDKVASIRIKDHGPALDDLRAKLTSLRKQFGEVLTRQTALETSINESFDRVERSVSKLEVSLMDHRRRMADRGAVEEGTSGGRADTPKPVPSLPEGLGSKVEQLSSSDPSIRWASVDSLIRSKDKKVVPYLLPMLKDTDTFVRRLTAVGLGNLGNASACASLVDALEDSEAIVRQAAYRSLVKLSGESYPFDGEASTSQRRTYVKRWRDWLKRRKGS